MYENVNVKIGSFHLPSLAFSILGSIAKANNYSPTILDLIFYDDPASTIISFIDGLAPVYIAFTCTSATYYLVLEAAQIIRSHNKSIKILIGGCHASSTAEEILQTGLFDFVFIGESEISFNQFLKGNESSDIRGLAFIDESGKIVKSFNSGFLKNLDDLPYPDYSLYDLSKYHISRLQARNNPVVWIETSRGCPFNCQVCNKIVHGQTFRPKSPERVLAEIKHFLELGVKEFHIADDGFTSIIDRAEKICDLIIESGLKFTWSCVNGIRVDRVTLDLLKKMRQAGCYRISFGIESGDQHVLNNLGKNVTLQQTEKAVHMAKKAGLEVFGFFMFGFEDETEQSMKNTIKFAKKLPLDLAKASIIMPFPGSPIYEKYLSLKLIYKTVDYKNFNVYQSPKKVYTHPSLDWDIIEKYQRRFYRSFYFNISYIFRRLIYSIKNGTLISDIAVGSKMDWFGRK